ncbi:MAG: hypothetical protein M1834_006837 [Cirrosporium novae-zelandiae]|nr:MAG: hypothetical protein M1834_006837 [Cirrosporium novae-zelandiae]
MEAPKKNLHIVILGAGTTGLLIAQGLQKNEISFSVYERQDENTYKNHPRQWAMGLFWGADDIQATLPMNLRNRFNEIKADPNYVPSPDMSNWWPMYNGKTGELITKIQAGQTGTARVSRTKMRRLFAEGLDVQYGKSAMDIKNDGAKVTVYFADGSTVEGDAVVGCDGIRSLARNILLGPEKAMLEIMPCRVVNIAQTYTADQAVYLRYALHPIVKLAAGHPSSPSMCILSLLDVVDESQPETWVFQVFFSLWGPTDQPADNSERLALFKSAASVYAEPWRSAVLWVKDDTFVPPDVISYWKDPVKWSNWNGRLTMAGDSAHPMPPYRAQGLNNAMQDAGHYVTSIVSVCQGEQSLNEAITIYDDEVFERGMKEIKRSAAAGPMMHDWRQVKDAPIAKYGVVKIQEVSNIAQAAA